MNFGMPGLPFLPFLLMLVWLGVWILGIYLVVRFLRAIERGVDAHERIAHALERRNP